MHPKTQMTASQPDNTPVHFAAHLATTRIDRSCQGIRVTMKPS